MVRTAVPPPAQSTVTPVTGEVPGVDCARIRSDDTVLPGCAALTASDEVVSTTRSIAEAVPSPVDDALAASAVASACDRPVVVCVGGVSPPPPPPQAVSSVPQASAAAAARRRSAKRGVCDG